MKNRSRQGAALLAVLWLSAALAAIAFTVATTVRGETDRAATLADSLRAHYLAAGGVESAILLAQGEVMKWQPERPGAPPSYNLGPPLRRIAFPTGVALVEVIPETARLSLNEASHADLYNLMLALQPDPGRARAFADGVLQRRGGRPNFGPSPSFGGPRASFEEVEEALLVRGMTPDIFYGTTTRDRLGRLVRVPGFRDCVSVYGTIRGFDANTAEEPLMASLGLGPEGARRIAEMRRIAPFKDTRQLGGLAGGRLSVGGHTMFTFRSTARLMLPGGVPSEVRRTVAALVKFRRPGERQAYQVLRWYDHASSEVSQWR